MARIRAMIVDDAIFMRATLKDILERHHFKVIASPNNGAKAVSVYKELYDAEKTPDIVLMDLTLPKMDGIEAIRRIKQIDQTANIVVCTSVNSKNKIAEAVQMGVTYVLYKPYEDEEEVLRIIKEALKGT